MAGAKTASKKNTFWSQPMYDLLILNATLVNEGHLTKADVAVADQRIVAIAPDLSSAPAKQSILYS